MIVMKKEKCLYCEKEGIYRDFDDKEISVCFNHLCDYVCC